MEQSDDYRLSAEVERVVFGDDLTANSIGHAIPRISAALFPVWGGFYNGAGCYQKWLSHTCDDQERRDMETAVAAYRQEPRPFSTDMNLTHVMHDALRKSGNWERFLDEIGLIVFTTGRSPISFTAAEQCKCAITACEKSKATL